MNTIELSIMSRGPSTAADLHRLLEPFEKSHHVHVEIQVLTWDTAWAELVKMALYGHGPAISEVGSTWIGNLVAMNALRPFAPGELMALGGADAFLAPAWRSGALANAAIMWAIPWLADTRILYYRRDWLARAGIAEDTAFASPAQTDDTLRRLRESGVAQPWAMATRATPNTLHNLSSWVWGAGGDFIDSTGQAVSFHQPAALAGLKAYFDLRRYLTPATADLASGDSNALFREGKVGVILSGPWVSYALGRGEALPEVLDNVGAALPPGPPFVGGSHLVVWKNAADARLAVELIHQLTGHALQANYPSLTTGLLPTRLSALEAVMVHPAHAQLTAALRAGRSFPTLLRWGLVEDKLVNVLGEIWAELKAQPATDLDALLHKKFDLLARRLEAILKQ